MVDEGEVELVFLVAGDVVAAAEHFDCVGVFDDAAADVAAEAGEFAVEEAECVLVLAHLVWADAADVLFAEEVFEELGEDGFAVASFAGEDEEVGDGVASVQ